MVWVGRDLHRSFKSPSHSNIANFFLIFFYLVWILYPVAWGLSEGGNVIQPDSEAVFYGILDLITFGLMPTILIFFAIKGCDEEFFSKLWQYHVKSEAESIHENEKLSLKPLQPKQVLLTLKLIMNLKLKFRV